MERKIEIDKFNEGFRWKKESGKEVENERGRVDEGIWNRRWRSKKEKIYEMGWYEDKGERENGKEGDWIRVKMIKRSEGDDEKKRENIKKKDKDRDIIDRIRKV